MSAINVLQYPDGAAVWTDGAHYLADGTMMAVAPKIEALPHLHAILAARAPSLFLPLMAYRLGTEFATFDALVEGMAVAVRIGFALHSALFDRCDHGADFNLVVVGWSESRGRCETWVMSSVLFGEMEPWNPQEMGPVLLMPYDDDLGDRLILTPEQLAGGLHPVEDGLRIIEAQRGVAACQGGREEPSHGVGGFAQMTFVGRHQITTAIMRRWPDAIGERLGAA